MSKIGIAIKATSAGAGNPISINGGEWTKYVIDIREILMSHIPSMKDDHSQMIIFSSYTEDACIITIARTISGRDWDNVAGWIYIPSNLVISGEEVKDLIDKIKNVIGKSELPDERELNELFGKDYQTKALSAKYEASKKDGRYAKRKIGAYYSLEELLGKDRYQSYYSEYNAVFFTKDIDEVKDAIDLSKKDLTSLFTFLPPSPEEIRYKLGKNVTLRLESGQIFDDAILVNKGQIINLKATHEGLLGIYFSEQVIEDEQVCQIPKGLIWRKRISSSLFNIESDTGEDLNDKATIEINHRNISNGSEDFPVQELSTARVSINVSGYSTFSQQIDLLRYRVYKITLEKKEVEYKKRIVLKDNSRGDIIITGKNVKKTECPLKGYDRNDMGELEYVRENVWIQRFYGFLAGIFVWLIFLFIGWWNSVEFSSVDGFPYYWFVTKESKSNYNTGQYTQQTQEEPNPISQPMEQENPQQENISFEDAIIYLDTNETWEKSELEKYPDLKGLFDDLNDMNTRKIYLVWGPKLSQSTNFKKIFKAAKKNYEKGWEPRVSPHRPKYNKENDYIINILGYERWLDKECTKVSESSNSNTSGSSIATPKKTQQNNSQNNQQENKFDKNTLN